MKAQKIVLLGLFLSIFSISFAQTAKKETIKVWGNCGMCKKSIESSAKKAGATKADWNTETKVLTVSYNAKSSSSKKIQEAIAASGYDTQDFTAPKEAYDKLHECCQYDRKGESTTEAKDSCCDDANCTHDKNKDMTCCMDGKCEKNKDCCKEGKCEKDCCKS